MEKLPSPEKRRTVVNYSNEEIDLKLSKDNTIIMIVPDRFEYSCVCFYDRTGEEDPILLFDPQLMDFLNEKGFHQTIIDDEIPEFVVHSYAQVQANKFAEEWINGEHGA